MTPQEKWYDKTWLVILLYILFWPVGLFALWKSTKIKTAWKIVGSAFIALIVVIAVSDDPKIKAADHVSQTTPAVPKSFKERLIYSKWIALDSVDNAYTTPYDSIDAHGIHQSGLTYHKSPLWVTFTEDSIWLEAPRLRAVFKMASIVYKHGTQIAGRPEGVKFAWEYDLDEDDSTITIDNGFMGSDIEIKFKDGKLYWPLWHKVGNDLIFVPQM